ncbi:Alpha/beta hydrolase family-domain-containing protein [Apiosordaria backusii]|uniref:Alpha/beta hydrolase family-domain-containing protein n=1 Tax=Apiosordaria backusii TaxID=314023 RepID=A0AA40DS87_9PEZI|nr:Alpha/beta hydrolase family-domain-containing protein [Apiosordaria backusii]
MTVSSSENQPKPTVRVTEYVYDTKPKYSNAVVLVHGDHQTGDVWVRKADNTPGWVTRFCDAGFRTFVIDLLYHIPDNPQQPPGREYYGIATNKMSKNTLQTYMTAPRSKSHKVFWPSMGSHCMWPGTGKAGDPIFERVFASMVPEYLDPQERQFNGQVTLAGILRTLEHPAILVGHGSGATISWLAADLVPHRVAGIIAIEPTGPPFTDGWVNDGEKRIYAPTFPDPLSLPLPSIRPYGLSEIPMGFVPPPLPPRDTNQLIQDSAHVGAAGTKGFQPIPFVPSIDPATKAPCYLQDELNGPVRTLPNLQNIPQCVVTGGSSFHSQFDYATVAFLRQAGVPVSHLKLIEDFGLYGNGHLLMLEDNSTEIADRLINWAIQNICNPNTNPQSPDLAPPATMTPQRGRTTQALSADSCCSTWSTIQRQELCAIRPSKFGKSSFNAR